MLKIHVTIFNDVARGYERVSLLFAFVQSDKTFRIHILETQKVTMTVNCIFQRERAFHTKGEITMKHHVGKIEEDG